MYSADIMAPRGRLRWADFVPTSDLLLKGQITQECQKATDITQRLSRRAIFAEGAFTWVPDGFAVHYWQRFLATSSAGGADDRSQ
jgi:hypothetical protein